MLPTMTLVAGLEPTMILDGTIPPMMWLRLSGDVMPDP
jgi:hypothetical protein